MRSVQFFAGFFLTVLISPAIANPIFTSELVSVVEEVPGAEWSFSLDGWDGGGSFSGFFAGIDVDGNGQLSSFAGEVTDFGASYSGGSIVGPIDFTLGGIFGLVYDLDGGPLGDGETLAIEGIGAFSLDAAVFIGPGPFQVCDGTQACGQIFGPLASVPAPATLALFGLGLLALTIRRRA